MSEESMFGFDFDDDVFVAKEKKKVTVSNLDYQAKVETDGWFHTDKNVNILMLEKQGPNQLKNSVEHNYLYKHYDKALEGALTFIDIARHNDKCKVNGTREMSEIAMHCAAKLNRLDLLGELLDIKVTVRDLGILLLRGRFFLLLGRLRESMDSYIEYHKERKLDYRVWYDMADIFMKSAEKSTKNYTHEMRYHLANLSMLRAIHIFTSNRWKLHIDVVKRRYERDLNNMQARLDKSMAMGGDADIFSKWMSSGAEGRECSGLEEFAWDDMVWIFKDWALRQDIDLDSEENKGVKDL
ncbi:hypothetical protein BDB01DRAFT_776774 [Pilobolus umbonatus]|nr:hypothetical protein BDB01DRAFT_776774 [Pilobolus umbonatus]